MNPLLFAIRKATLNDAPDIANLCGQLGYPVSAHEISERLEFMRYSGDHAVYAAFGPEGRAAGWIHVFISHRVESGAFAEIGGLIVSESFRCMGIGRALIAAAEKWTGQRKCSMLRVRTSSAREDAKKFYSKAGFSVSKQQHVFDKTIKE